MNSATSRRVNEGITFLWLVESGESRRDGRSAVGRLTPPAAQARRKRSAALIPPKPNELLNRYSGAASRPAPVRYGGAHAGSADSRLTVGGSQPRRLASAQMAASMAPLAPSAWP